MAESIGLGTLNVFRSPSTRAACRMILLSAQWPRAGPAREYAVHMFHTGRHVCIHTHRMVEIGSMTQRIGLGFKKEAGQRAMVRYGA